MTRNDMIQIYSDFHKNAYGVRPRFNYHEFSLERLQADFKNFGEICDLYIKEAEDMKKWAKKQEEKRKAEALRLHNLKTLGEQFPMLAQLLTA